MARENGARTPLSDARALIANSFADECSKSDPLATPFCRLCSREQPVVNEGEDSDDSEEKRGRRNLSLKPIFPIKFGGWLRNRDMQNKGMPTYPQRELRNDLKYKFFKNYSFFD